MGSNTIRGKKEIIYLSVSMKVAVKCDWALVNKWDDCL